MISRRTRSKRTIASVVVAFAAGGLLVGSDQFVRADTPATPSTTVAVAPYRILDTRNGVGAPAAPVHGGQTVTVQIAGVGPVPAGATGVILNLTGTQVTDATYVSAWPAGEVQQDTSVLNLTPGIDSPNMITAALGGGGALNLYNFTGSVHLVADVAGYLLPGGGGGTPGPQGPAGPPGDPDVTAGTTTLMNTDFEATNLPMSLGALASQSWPARRATISVPELTQDIIDRGSVEVAVRPFLPAQSWTPLPLRFSNDIGNYSRAIDVRYSVGMIEIYYSFQWEDSAVGANVINTALPNLPVRWVVRPG